MKATFNVERMSVRGGMLWMGWPSDIGKALDVLLGINNHSFKLEFQLFSVDYTELITNKKIISNTIENMDNFKVINWKEEKD